MALAQIPEGMMTHTIYGLIKGQKFREALKVLSEIKQSQPRSRPALSLTAYCHYQLQEFAEAATCYQTLADMHPEEASYGLYLAQSKQKACLFDEAHAASLAVEDPAYSQHILKLQAAIKFGQGNVAEARGLVEQCRADDPDTLNNQACIMYSEGDYVGACAKFSDAWTRAPSAHLAYNMALCLYRLRQFAPALKHIADIIEKGMQQHPELNIGLTTEGHDVRSVGNTQTLHNTALIEAFNLKAAIEYTLRNVDGAMEALTDMPPRSEEELDPVTLHNHALINMDEDVNGGFEKFQFLLQQNPCPPETFSNLLLLYCKYEHYDFAADVLAENAHLTYELLTQSQYDYLDATITRQTSPDEAFRKFDEMGDVLAERLRKATKSIQEFRANGDSENMKKCVDEYDETMDWYVPVIMAQAKIYWDMRNYAQVEKIFRKSVEICNDNDVWKLNVAHVLFMQETKYKEAIGFYEPIVKRDYNNILDVSASVLANLCVAYIMTSANDQAEEVMRLIEKEEEELAYEEPDRKVYHLCTVNLVIGTLYCARSNPQFGISRIIKSLEPLNKKLGCQTWAYAKRCFLSVIENMAKQIVTLPDSVCQDIIDFFDACEQHGKLIPSVEDLPLNEPVDIGRCTVAFEARFLKELFLRVMV